MRNWMRLIAMAGALTFLQPASFASAVSVDITVGDALWNKGRISCSQGAKLLRSKGYDDVSRRDCYGRYYVYRAWRNFRYFEIAVDSRHAKVVDRRRLR